jgi:hypothetical protein
MPGNSRVRQRYCRAVGSGPEAHVAVDGAATLAHAVHVARRHVIARTKCGLGHDGGSAQHPWPPRPATTMLVAWWVCLHRNTVVLLYRVRRGQLYVEASGIASRTCMKIAPEVITPKVAFVPKA